MPDTPNKAGVLHELSTLLSGVDDYNGMESMHNDPPTLQVPTENGVKAYKYAYSRPAKTIAPDNEPGTEGLGKATAVKKNYEPRTFTPEQRAFYDKIMEKADRAPDYIFFGK